MVVERKKRKLVLGVLLIAVSLFLLVCLVASLAGAQGFLGDVGGFLKGFFGLSGIILLLIFIAIGICKASGISIKPTIAARVFFSLGVWSAFLIVQLATSRDNSGLYVWVNDVYTYGDYLAACYNGTIVAFGGALVGITFYPLFSLLGLLGSWVAFIGLLCVSLYFVSAFLLSLDVDVKNKLLAKSESSKKAVSKPKKHAAITKEAEKSKKAKQATETPPAFTAVQLPPLPSELKEEIVTKSVPENPARRKARRELFGEEKVEELIAPPEQAPSPQELLFGEKAKRTRKKEVFGEDAYIPSYEEQAKVSQPTIGTAPVSDFGDTIAPKILHETQDEYAAGFGSSFIPGQNVRTTETRAVKTRSNIPQNKDLLKYKEDDLYGVDQKNLPPIIDGDAYSRHLRGLPVPEKKKTSPRINRFGYPEIDASSTEQSEADKPSQRIIPVTVAQSDAFDSIDSSESNESSTFVPEAPTDSFVAPQPYEVPSASDTPYLDQPVEMKPEPPEPVEAPVSIVGRPLANGAGLQMTVEEKDLESVFKKREYPRTPYKAPPLDCLRKPPAASGDQDDLQMMASVLEDTLAVFKISAEVKNIIRGPSVARFELSLPPGVSINKVINLSKDIERELCVKSQVRLLTHIPNKNLFGIEVPLNYPRPVFLRSMLESANFKKEGHLRFALGMDIEGNVLAPDLAKLPHLLMGGATGNGKSVCLNSLIVSLLYKYSPEELRFIVVDPKFVEFSYMKNLPHMLMPQSIPTAEKAINAFNWLVIEMDRRYAVFSEIGVRNVSEYNDMIDKEIYEPMPRIVLIVDELNDLMSFSKHEFESKITRLTQKARAAGIHLVLATQRPSVDVVTGTIKTNLPGRIALKVTSVNDSRTILDTTGPEKLSGPGDMLFLSGTELIRVQGAYVSGDELENIASYIRANNPSHFFEEAEKLINEENSDDSKSSEKDNDRETDPYFVEALKLAVSTGNASISMLQRKFKIGFGRAGNIVEAMEAKGYVSKQEQNKPRTVYLSPDEFNSIYGSEYGKI